MDAIENGARQAVVNCVKIQSGEQVVVITDQETAGLADAIVRQVKAVGATPHVFVMEEFGPRSSDGVSPLALPLPIAEALAQAQASFYIAAGKPGELKTFRIPMIDLVEKHGVRHAHMPNFIEAMMSQGMASDYAKIQELSARVHAIVKDAREIRVTTPAGTDLLALFSKDRKWIVSDGDIRAGHWSNLPDGEVFTSPIDANGTVVVDGCLGDFFNQKYGDLESNPVGYELKDGRCVRGSVRCTRAELKAEFEKYTFETDENACRLGEFAIGTNIGLTGLIGNLLQDEKFPGVHLALGSPYPTKTGADWDSAAHNDGILRRPTITVGDRVIMETGRFLI